MALFHDSAIVGASGNQGGAGGYQISRSLRFNSADSAYLSRTPASAGNRQTWTLSWWMKRSKIGGVNEFVFGTGGSNTVAQIFFDSSEKLRYGTFTGEPLVTAAVFRDTSAWYHCVFVHNTANATAADRLILYVNGVRADTSTYTAPSQNSDGAWNRAVGHVIGGTADGGSGAAQPSFNGYLADIHFIDGQALTPSSFAETNATTGQWVPKAYSGSYGTNGFQLKFADNSNNTAATLGKDTSGNGNNWTPNNLSVTAGAGNDSLVDTPTSYGTDTGTGGEVRGNYCTLNPLSNSAGSTLTNGNLDVTTTVSGPGGVLGTIAIPESGKWYFECTPSANGNLMQWGIANGSRNVLYYGGSGSKQIDDVETSYGATFTTSDVLAIAINVDSGSVTFYKNNTSQGSITYSFAGKTLFPYVGDGTNSNSITASINFGQRPFAYTAPSGFKALCDTNLPAPVVAKPNQYFGVGLYTGNNGSNTITTGIDNTANAGLLWIKNRTTAVNHNIYDKVRGYSSLLELPTTAAEYSYSVSLAETSTGYTLNTSSAQFNASGSSYVAWNWAAGSSIVTNTSGSISSQVRANASAGFSIVTYTGNGTVGATVGHGLGVAPAMLIVKRRDAASAARWAVQHTSLTAAQLLALNTTAAVHTEGAGAGSTFNVTKAGSSVFTLGDYGDSNANTGTYVAYCFAPVAGYSAFGSYTGNGSIDGPLIYTGFRPRWVMIKRSDAVGSWGVLDTARNTFNVSDKLLWANLSDAEGTYTIIDALSNGFKLRESTNGYNTSSGTYIYAAFAENPFQYARAR